MKPRLLEQFNAGRRPIHASLREHWILLATAIAVAGLSLRAAITSVPPLLADIQQDVAASSAGLSVLTSLPVLCFGAGAVLAERLARRFLLERLIAIAFMLAGAGLLVRVLPSHFYTVLFGTLIATSAIAIANVLIPPVIKRNFPVHGDRMMGIYISLLIVGAALAASVAVPIARSSTALGWRAGLGVWAIPCVVAALLWYLTAPKYRDCVSETSPPSTRTPLRDAVAWQVTVFMGLQIMTFYSLLSWLPTILRERGLPAEAAAQVLSIMILIGAPVGLFVPWLATRFRRQSGWAAGSVILMTIGVIGLAYSSLSYSLFWAILIGIGTGVSYPLALTFILLRTRDGLEVAQLSAMSQGIGYTLGAAGPFLFGMLRSWTGGWHVPFFFVLTAFTLQLLAGVYAGRDVTLATS